MFARELRQAGHTRRFIIHVRGTEGWEVREEQDEEILRRICYTDWHRVERALQVFTIRIGDLQATGWSD